MWRVLLALGCRQGLGALRGNVSVGIKELSPAETLAYEGAKGANLVGKRDVSRASQELGALDDLKPVPTDRFVKREKDFGNKERFGDFDSLFNSHDGVFMVAVFLSGLIWTLA